MGTITIKDKRDTQPPVPENWAELLTADQHMTLSQYENYGWELAFIRRPLFQEVTVVIRDASGELVGVLEKNGSINKTPDIILR